MRKKFLKTLVCLILLLTFCCMSLTGCGAEKKKDTSGKVEIYTSIYPFAIDMMAEKLKEEFPELDIEFFYGGTGTLQTKLAGEMETGTLGCDMMLVAEPAYSLELKEEGWLHSFAVENADTLLRFPYDPDGYWYPVRVCNMVLAYNPELYSPEELPATFYDFAYDESLKGLISMGNPLTSGTTMAAIAALSDKYGYEYFEALGRNDVMIESGSTALAKLQTGECKVIMILEESVLKERKENGSELACIYPEDGVILMPSTVMIVDEEKSLNMNTEACEQIARWMLSEEGQQLILEAYMHSVAANTVETPYDSVDTDRLIAQDMGVDWERCYKEREEIRTKFQEYVTVE